MKRKLQFISILSLLTFSVIPGTAAAEEIAITGNGSDSETQVNLSQNTNTAVSQDNDMNVDNNVNLIADTGDNEASDNTAGDTSASTGNVSINTSILNSGNTSTVTQDCCKTQNNGGAITISGNGTGSQNLVNQNISSQTTVRINQNANITNNIFGTAITGNNKANDNNHGDVSITTGDIKVFEKIQNAPVNVTKVSLAKTVAAYTMFVKIAGNGSYSDNEANLNNHDDADITINNNANILNNSNWDLITGNNEAQDNTKGDISILTGDIAFHSEIKNVVNISKVEIKSCEEKKQKEKEKQKEVPTAVVTTPERPTEKKSEDKPSGGRGGGGEVLGTAIGKILPVTGYNWFPIIIIGNILMLLFGVTLRLRAGRSPNEFCSIEFLKPPYRGFLLHR